MRSLLLLCALAGFAGCASRTVHWTTPRANGAGMFCMESCVHDDEVRECAKRCEAIEVATGPCPNDASVICKNAGELTQYGQILFSVGGTLLIAATVIGYVLQDPEPDPIEISGG
jgi:hypothetical protein